MKAETKSKGGRPKLKIDPKLVESLAHIGCTTPEIAAIVDCSEDTLERRFAGVMRKGRHNMKSSLRRMQYKSAEAGNVTMQIWLGKQHLGQSDKQEVTGDANKPLVIRMVPDSGPLVGSKNG